ncbi:hypothetical protein BU16DRAFT_90011 [Lophium mytilinum]|uniref:Uncharacterized protein n=1 Tax=Lophium mytilinum TaxID=390894 RepID=A0A6A6QKF8_9PEZI|nr:hypothetical protein BU16DRAFT_90011 [Lophium mytilinum]
MIITDEVLVITNHKFNIRPSCVCSSGTESCYLQPPDSIPVPQPRLTTPSKAGSSIPSCSISKLRIMPFEANAHQGLRTLVCLVPFRPLRALSRWRKA